MVKFIYVERVKSITATVENAPHLIFCKIFFRIGGSALPYLIFNVFKRVLYQGLDFKHGGTHVLLVDAGVLQQLEEMRILYFLAFV